MSYHFYQTWFDRQTNIAARNTYDHFAMNC